MLYRWWTRIVVGGLLLGLSQAAGASEARLLGPAGKCLGVDGAVASQARVMLSACRDDARGQVWQLPARGFSGEARLGELCLDVAGGAADDFAPLQLFPCHGGANQRWLHETTGRLVGLEGRCLDIAGGATADGSPAILFGCHGQDHQIFLADPRDGWAPTHFQENAFFGSRLLPTGNPEVAYLDGDNLSRSGDQGRTWASTARATGEGIREVMVDRADENRLLALDRLTGQVLRSDDGARSWRPVADLGARVLAQSRGASAEWLAFGTSSFWTSGDGQSFTLAGAVPQGTYGSLFFLDDVAGNWLLGLADGCGFHQPCAYSIYRSGDRGQTWQLVHQLSSYYDLVASAHPAEEGAFYLLNDGDDILRSDDGGRTFAVAGSLPGPVGTGTRLIGDPNHAERLWTVGGGVWRSHDRGVTWTPQLETLLDGWAAGTVAFLSPTQMVMIANWPFPFKSKVLHSLDAGATWSVLNDLGVHGGSLGYLVAGRSPGLYFGGGLSWRTRDYGRHWEFLANRYLRTAVADPTETETVYAFGDDGRIERSRDGGQTLEGVTPPSPPIGGRVKDLVAVAHGGGTMLVAIYDFNQGEGYRSVDRGETWERVTIASDMLTDLETDGRVVYAETRLEDIAHSTDGRLWSPIPPLAYTEFEAGAGKWAALVGGELWVGIGGATTKSPWPGSAGDQLEIDSWGRIYTRRGGSTLRSTDNGRSWQSLDLGTFEEILQVVADPFDPQRMMASTAIGPLLGRFSDPTVVSLGQGRFTVQVRWRGDQGQTGIGRGGLLSHDVAAFRLFSEERDEVVVKVLDGRSINGRFWTFVGSLTDAELDIEVVDRVSGERRSYHKPRGTFASFGDTLAFPRGAAEVASMPLATRPLFQNGVATEIVLGERFSLSAEWTTGVLSGAAWGRALAGDTAAFTFFSPENVELLVNVIDGRAINGHYWVFVGSLGNVGFSVRVTDLLTGQERVYDSPNGSFASFGDTQAF
jgi:hypothetical protein